MNRVDTILEAKNLCHTIKPIFCHTERSEVSQSTKEIFRSAQNDNRDISAFSKPQYDKKIKDLQSQINSLIYALYSLYSVQIKNHQILIITSLSLSLRGESKKAFYYCDKSKMLFFVIARFYNAAAIHTAYSSQDSPSTNRGNPQMQVAK